MSRPAQVRLRRVYEPASPGEGARVLVDRVWPRGVRRADLALQRWARQVAPSGALRTWYGHDPARFAEFRRRYLEELATGEAAQALAELRELAAATPVVLLTATRDLEHSQAAVLAEVLTAR